jgi:hypothetical protein
MNFKVEETIDKVAFVLESVSTAKEMLVKDEGIGEDLTFNLYCWKDDVLVMILQMNPQKMWIDSYERFKYLTNAAFIARRGWGIDEFTLAAEGYCSINPEDTKHVSLSESYSTNPNIKSCLTFTHVNRVETAIVTRPYVLTWPRKVQFDSEMYYPGQSILRRKDGTIPSMLLRIIDSVDVDIKDMEELDTYYETLTEGLADNGFLVSVF